ncbi:hypothetical protein Asulf_00510 [Archaeoglobus sulfaticallidus PM70-1]|uniref:Lipoyl-binding domain-containing protein n=1 Tax=Archaeoglobus sulfaticallidus PM70-1 TaxID=387631 RepID=N0BC31_9EURY|nr:biotin/lipoyl-containing protein [Archaeoglobus sulfaticallidus]AGK60533.1 hypothetical protein Asulf_00510 [Archaeoglobus sulfaticallidus PM70-1]
MKYSVFVKGKKYDVEVEEIEPNVFSVSVSGKTATIKVEEVSFAKPVEEKVEKVERVERVEKAEKVEAGEGTPVKVSMAGVITKVLKNEGEEIEEGEDILILEAMKMENAISAPKSGKITKITVKEGDRVSAGDVVAYIS